MTTVNPTPPAQLFLHPVAEHTDREGRQHELRTDQIIRAVVVEDEGGQLMLELRHRRFMTKTEMSLRPGQQLDVRVLATQPHLALQILPPPRTQGRLDRMLSALGLRLNWEGLTEQAEGARSQMPPGVAGELGPPLHALKNLLQTGPALNGQHLAQLSKLLGLSSEAEAIAGDRLPGNLKVGLLALLKLSGEGAEKGSEQLVRQVLRTLQQLPKEGVSGALEASVKSVTTQLRQLHQQLPDPFARALEPAMFSLQQWRSPAQAGRGVALAALERALGVPLTRESAVDLVMPPDLRTGLLLVAGRVASGGTQTHQSESLVADNARQLLRQLEALPRDTAKLAATLPEVRGLLVRVEGFKGSLPPNLNVLLEGPLSRLRTALPPEWLKDLSEQELMVVSAALGLEERSEIVPPFRGSDSARVILEILLGLLSRGGESEIVREAESALQQIEVLQLARGKLHEEGTQLLPLPFPFLEEGYFLIDTLPDGEGENEEEGGYRLRLYLKLQQLGNVKVEALYQGGGLFLRVSSESGLVAGFLEKHRHRLETELASVSLRSLTFAQGAEDPGTELVRRLREADSAMLDQRI